LLETYHNVLLVVILCFFLALYPRNNIIFLYSVYTQREENIKKNNIKLIFLYSALVGKRSWFQAVAVAVPPPQSQPHQDTGRAGAATAGRGITAGLAQRLGGFTGRGVA
jgi:hypothetical protein